MTSGPPLNLFRVLPHAGPAAIGFLRLGSALLRENALDSRLRELVILRVGVLCRAGYEVHQHRRVARAVGVSQEKIAATDAVVQDVKAPDALYEAVADRLDHRCMAELVLTIGYYMMVSRFLENFEVEIEAPGGTS